MWMEIVLLGLAVILAHPTPSTADAAQTTLDIWPGKVPGEVGSVGEEKAKTATLPDGTTVSASLTNVSKPTLTAMCVADEVLFQDNLAGKLGDGWAWVREEKSAWRVTDKGLEIRVLPGNLWGRANDARNVLVRPAPDTAQGEVEVSVTVTNQPSHQFEQADLAWYYDDSNMVKLGLELVSGEVCIVMGREQADKTRTLAKIPIGTTSVRLRLRIAGNRIRGQYLPAGTNKWLDAGAGDLPTLPNGPAKISLHCYQGPPDAEHWARFSAFQVLRVSQ